jgi:short-subunit dehydrogenase
LLRPGRAIELVAQDLASEAGRKAVIEAGEAMSIDLLISNAGMAHAGDFCAMSVAAERDTINVNVVAVTEILHALIPAMVDRAVRDSRRCGVIIVSSTAAFSPSGGLATYKASKAFQLLLAQSIAAELADKPIDILALCPTYTATEFFARAGISAPRDAQTPEAVAAEAMAALGQRNLYICSLRPMPQELRQFLTLNPALDFRYWPKQAMAWLKRGLRG